MIEVKMVFGSVREFEDYVARTFAKPVDPPNPCAAEQPKVEEVDSSPAGEQEVTEAPKKRKRRTKAQIEADEKGSPESQPEEAPTPSEPEVKADESLIAQLRAALIGAKDRTDMKTVLDFMQTTFGEGVTKAHEIPVDRHAEAIELANKLGL